MTLLAQPQDNWLSLVAWSLPSCPSRREAVHEQGSVLAVWMASRQGAWPQLRLLDRGGGQQVPSPGEARANAVRCWWEHSLVTAQQSRPVTLGVTLSIEGSLGMC